MGIKGARIGTEKITKAQGGSQHPGPFNLKLLQRSY
jgi:hypothetical protein